MNSKIGMAFAGLSMGVVLGGTAHAQSSVTLYGVVDTGVTYTNNQQGHSNWEATSGNESAPRFGLMGTEDLGGGLKTIFRLENGFNIDNGKLGQGGRLFGRQAYVGVSSDKFGTVTFGRQYNPVQDILGYMQGGGVLTDYSVHPHDNDDINNTFRVNNSAKYVSPSFAGLQASLLYAFSNSTGFASNNSWSAGLNYANGPFSLGAAYTRMNNPASSAVGAVASDNYYGSESMFDTPLGSATRQQIWGAGGTYTLGSAQFELLYTGSRFDVPAASSLRFDNYEGTVVYYVTPFVVLAASQVYTHVTQGELSGHFNQTTLGAKYLLSKRTDLYVNVTYQKASSSIGQAWIESDTAPSSTATQVLSVVGIRHKF
ncbi:porin [Paraburkholderia caffeinilytica]|uniref:porin n=1 Tax=Paraburkholderia caffeinilytica TaxID=1761016 RepID=UPI0038BCD54F